MHQQKRRRESTSLKGKKKLIWRHQSINQSAHETRREERTTRETAYDVQRVCYVSILVKRRVGTEQTKGARSPSIECVVSLLLVSSPSAPLTTLSLTHTHFSVSHSHACVVLFRSPVDRSLCNCELLCFSSSLSPLLLFITPSSSSLLSSSSSATT